MKAPKSKTKTAKSKSTGRSASNKKVQKTTKSGKKSKTSRKRAPKETVTNESIFGKVNVKKQKTLGLDAVMSVTHPGAGGEDLHAPIDQMIDQAPVGTKSKKRTTSAKKQSTKKGKKIT